MSFWRRVFLFVTFLYMLLFYTIFMAVFSICGIFVTNLAIFRHTEWSLQVQRTPAVQRHCIILYW